MQNNRDSRKPARDTGESRLRRSVQQLKVFGVADAAHRPLLAELIDAPNINCLGIQAPSAETVRKAVSLPIDALVLFSSGLDGRTQSFMQEYQNSRQGVASILITDQDITVELMQLAMSCGINSVIPAIGGKELICSVIDEETNKILTRSETAEIRQYDSRVILVYSSKGGAGKTTLAVNLAASLKLRGKKVTVVDLDLASGDVHSFLNLENSESIGELAAEEQLTPAVIKSYLVPSQTGVDVLCAPSSPQYAANVRPEHISAILMTLRAENDYVVIDCDQQLAQGSIADCNMQAMNEADLILFVVNPEIPTINGASVMLNKYLAKVPGLTEKTRLVVNKTGSDSPITPAEIARTLDRKLYMAIRGNRSQPDLLPKDEGQRCRRGSGLVPCRLEMRASSGEIHAIRKYYGKGGAYTVGIALFLACLFFTMGNISGTGAGMNLIFGLNWKLGSLILICVVVYTYFAKNVYSKVEKLITACIIIMIAAFYITLFGVSFKATGENGVVGFEGGAFFKGLFGFKVPAGSLGTALAFISTNAAITTGIYNTYLGKEKKWKKEDLFNGVMLTDALVHMISVVLISGAIILVGAIVLHPQGLAIKAPAQLAAMLEPIMGPAAKYIMGFALVGAGFSSLLANTQRGMVLLGAGIEKEFGLESKFIRYGCLACLAFAMAICYSFNGSPTQLILIANIATSIATPVGGLFVLLLIWRKDVNEGYKAPTALRICMTISYVFVLIMTVSAFQKTIIPGIAKLFS